MKGAKKMKKIILVTHGEAEPKPNGSLTQKGREQMKELKLKIPFDKIELVISGTARRHRESCLIVAGRRADIVSEIVGVPDVLSSDGKCMLLADGEKISIEKYLKARYKQITRRVNPFLKRIFKRPEKRILIVGGRITAIGAGIDPKQAKSGWVYHLTLTSGEIKITD